MSKVTEAQKPTEICISGRLYDCTNFKHPGGSIIKFYLGSGDATEAFGEFHCKISRAWKYLDAMPSRPAPVNPAASSDDSLRLEKMSRDFKKLRDDLQREGWYDPNYLHVVYRLAEIVVMHAVGIYLLATTSVWPAALLVLGLAEGRCGWLQHEGGHCSLTGNLHVDRMIQEIVYGFGDGMSASWWRVQHNKHHAAPQKLKHDVDLDTLPLVAWHERVAQRAKKSPLMRKWISWQMYLFAPITCSLVALFWQFYLHPRHIHRTRRHTEAAAVACRYLFIAGLCWWLGYSVWQSCLGYLMYQFVGATYIFIDFALSHTHLDVLPSDKHAHWLEFASVYTVNVAPHRFTDWWMSYLNYQIEHHLFPCIPQYRFPALSPRIREFFNKHGLPYVAEPYWSTMALTFRNLGTVANTLHA